MSSTYWEDPLPLEPFERVGSFDFFALPRELRDKVYTEVLQPEYLNSFPTPELPLGCTSILCTNRQARAEGLELFSSKEHVINISCDYRHKLFRSMFAFGKPSFLRGRETVGKLPQRYCELQVVRFPRIGIKIIYPFLYNDVLDDSDAKALDNLKDGIEQIIRCLTKSRDLRTLRLCLQPNSHPEALDENFPWSERTLLAYRTLTPFLELAKSKNINLLIDTNKYFRGNRRFGRYWEHYDWVDPVASMLGDDWNNMKSSISTDHNADSNDYGHLMPTQIDPPGADYKLVPECRVCYRIFESRTALNQHLKQSRHTSVYRHKAENKLGWVSQRSHRNSTWLSRYICFTCGETFSREKEKNDHCKWHAHWRSTIISRWVNYDWEEDDPRNGEARREKQARDARHARVNRLGLSGRGGHGSRGGGRGGR